VEVFKNTPTSQLEQRFNALKAKLESLEERMQQHEGEISALQAEQSRQLRVQESIEQRI
jgi:chaperonin cofactor prefoldin